MPEEAPLERTETGSRRTGEGWFVLNACEARWYRGVGRGARVDFEGDVAFEQLGVGIFVLEPGEAMGKYHWEANQEDFLLLSGEGLLIVEGEERPLRRWDYVHCPPGTDHIILGAGAGPSAFLAVGSRERGGEEGWGGYVVDEVAQRHGAGVDEPTIEARVAYADSPPREPTAYREGWLAGD
jgi:uncharacterized cupin superfamily protein